MRTVSVALPVPLRRNFTYGVPGTPDVPAPGTRVRVPFGERVLTGLVVPERGDGTDPEAARCGMSSRSSTRSRCARRSSWKRREESRSASSRRKGEVLRSALPARLPAAGAVRYRITEKGRFGEGASAAGEHAFLDRLADGGRFASPSSLRRPARPATSFGRSRSAVGSGPRRRIGGRHAAPSARTCPRASTQTELDLLLRRSRRGRDVFAYLQPLGRPATAAEILLATGAGPGVLRSLAAKGVLATFDQVERDDPSISSPSRIGCPRSR